MEEDHKDLAQVFYKDFPVHPVKELPYEAYHPVAEEKIVVGTLVEAPSVNGSFYYYLE